MKNFAIIVLISVSVAFLMAVPYFVYLWYDHTVWVQEQAEQTFREFQEADINWDQFDTNRSSQEMHREISTVVIAIPYMFDIGFREQSYAYRETLYNVIAVVVNDPENQEMLTEAINQARYAQVTFYMAAENFINHTFLAMGHTF